jgi:four helix bundle protein
MRFEDMDLWQDTRKLCKEIFEITNDGAFKSDFRFRDQIRASSGSIMDNLAEGFERGGNKELIQFLYIAKGSCGETRSQIYRALDFNYINKEDHQKICAQCVMISRKISGFINYLKQSNLKGDKYSNQ